VDWRHRRLHPENWGVTRSMLTAVLRATGLYERGRRNARRFRLRRRRLVLPGLAPALDGYRLLQLSDLHLDVDHTFARELARRIAGVTSDSCVITGDFRFSTDGPIEPMLRAIDLLRPALPQSVYAVLGNHDSITMIPPLEARGIRVLFNESALIHRQDGVLALAGVDDPHYFDCADPRRAAAGLPADVPRLLLAHSPECYVEAEEAGFDAMLCGHTHGGQIRLPGDVAVLTNARCPRRYCHGAWRYRRLYGYTSAGTGSSVLDVRFNCPPEVLLHVLRPASPQGVGLSSADSGSIVR
jgi:uncharacterized protein